MPTPTAAVESSQPSPRPTPLWEVVALADFQLPRALDPAAVRKRWGTVKQVLGLRRTEAPAPVRLEADLQALPPARLASLVPPIDWTPAARALDAAIGDWPAAEPPVRFLIGPPHASHADILRRWAVMHGALTVAAPAPGAVLAGGESWLAAWQAATQATGVHSPRCWVLPALERCYLRHANGLGLIRRLLWLALSGRLGPGLIGCDSWAWTYLQHVWDLPQVGAYTVQGFDGHRLTAHLANCADPDPDGRLPRFCNACSSTQVLPDLDQIARGDFTVSSQPKQLAARCRGNPGIARLYWQARLRVEPEDGRAAEAADDGAEARAPGDQNPAAGLAER